MREAYVPVLKWKKGEEAALRKLSEIHKEQVIPLIEITDYQDPEEILEGLKASFDRPIYIDTLIAAEDDREYLVSIISKFSENDYRVYPVIYADDLDNTLDELIKLENRIAIRISVPEDIEGLGYEEIFSALEKLQSENNLILDIILDIGVITKGQEANRQFSELKQIFSNYLINKSFYNSLIICSTSFPEDISSIQPGECVKFNRYDIKIFKKFIKLPEIESLVSKLVYSDFGVTKFTETEIDFKKLKNGILPKIKYTTDNDYIVLKGKRKKQSKELQISYIDLSNQIIESDYYYGKEFSFGDLDIYERAKRENKKGPGGNKDWVTISANHHIAVVVEQLSKIL
jgi:hypothetical protein